MMQDAERHGRPLGLVIALLCALNLLLGLAPTSARGAELPNIVLVLADDMGWGDTRCYNPESKCPTPSIDRLASQGIRFLDAHAAGSLCIVSRYGLLTGRYPWRNTVQRKSTGGYAGSLIERGRTTIASLLASRGYSTACVGKWHLGFGAPDEDVDYDQPLSFGPNQLGFDHFFGLPASLDIEPYVYVQNDRVTEPLDQRVAASETPGARWAAGKFWRAGRTTKSFRHEEVLDRLTGEAVRWLDERTKASERKPFFLYLALTAPHTPWLPTEPFRGKSGAGDYGDFVVQVDAAVGRVAETIDRLGLREDTIFIFSSDNGAFWVEEEIERYGHRANGPWRGQKADIWEGGHRVPFIVRWPGKAPAGETSDQLLCFTDLMATFAAITGAGPLPNDAGEDSFDQLPAIRGRPRSEGATRPGLVLQAGPGYTIREDGWKLITFRGSGGFTKPRVIQPPEGEPKGQLYHIAVDPGEQSNLWAADPERVKRLEEALQKHREAGRTRPASP